MRCRFSKALQFEWTFYLSYRNFNLVSFWIFIFLRKSQNRLFIICWNWEVTWILIIREFTSFIWFKGILLSADSFVGLATLCSSDYFWGSILYRSFQWLRPFAFRIAKHLQRSLDSGENDPLPTADRSATSASDMGRVLHLDKHCCPRLQANWRNVNSLPQ